MRQSPNDALAELVARKLIDAGLVPEEEKGQLEAKLKSGSLSQVDWSQWIDAATAPSDSTGGSDVQADHQD
jgi:hypothetical protein